MQQSWAPRDLEFHPNDDALPPYFTTNKALALLMALAGQSLIQSSTAISRGNLASSSTAISSRNQIVSLSGQIGQLQSLNPPSSNPALKVQQSTESLLRESERGGSK